MIACLKPYPDYQPQPMRTLEEETEGLLAEIVAGHRIVSKIDCMPEGQIEGIVNQCVVCRSTQLQKPVA